MANGTWQEQTVGGHPCDVFRPDTPHEQGFVILYLHGVHVTRLPDVPEFVRPFAELGFPLVSPITQQSWWSDRICPAFDPERSAEQHILQEILPFIQREFDCEPPRLALLGTSMGGQGALRFAYKFPNVFPVSAAIAPAIDHHVKYREGDEILMQMYPEAEAVRQDTATLHIHPLNWPRFQFFCCDPEDVRWWDGADRLRMKLYSLGVPHECDLDTSAGGHGFEYYTHMAPRAAQYIETCLKQLNK